ncbi:MAG: anti-sigma factor domain-containing protein [Paracoccaceae bacterium]
MTDIPLPTQQDDDTLAGEYVLGVLNLTDRLAAEARLKTDPAFAAQVVRWESHFAPLNEGYASVPVPDGLFSEIEARLFPVAPSSRTRWHMWLAGALTAAAIMVALLMLMPPSSPGRVIANLGAPDAVVAYQARHDSGHLIVSRITGSAPPAGQTHELWVIAPGAAPVSLGVIGLQPLDVEYPLPPSGWVLAISVEPEGGSPTGAPTGPVILTAEVGA